MHRISTRYLTAGQLLKSSNGVHEPRLVRARFHLGVLSTQSLEGNSALILRKKGQKEH